MDQDEAQQNLNSQPPSPSSVLSLVLHVITAVLKNALH